MPVTVEELVGSPLYTGSGKELTAVRNVRIAWSDIENYYVELFPPPALGIPQLPAKLPGSAVLYADTVSFKPDFEEALITSYGPPNNYAFAIATVSYRTRTISQDSGGGANPIISRHVGVSGEVMTIPTSGLQWQNNGGPANNKTVSEDVTAGKVIPGQEHKLTFHRVPTPPYATLRSLIGKVNSTTFEGAPAETVLFVGAELKQEVTTDGTMPWTIEMTFTERTIKQGSQTVGWNHFYRPETGQWEYLVTKVGSDKMYAAADLNDIFD